MIVNFNILRNRDKTQINELGLWLDQNMPNPPLPEPQRWTIKSDRQIEFVNDVDASMFLLVWE
jgi:hypothetical protein